MKVHINSSSRIWPESNQSTELECTVPTISPRIYSTLLGMWNIFLFVFFFPWTTTSCLCCVCKDLLVKQRGKKVQLKSAHSRLSFQFHQPNSTVPSDEEGFIWKTLWPRRCSELPFRIQSCSSLGAVSQHWLITTNLKLIMSHYMPLCFSVFRICLSLNVSAKNFVFGCFFFFSLLKIFSL